jgi:DNA-directed RNA polymerase specialized sigma24 family protein
LTGRVSKVFHPATALYHKSRKRKADMANANQVILTVTEAMKLGATTRSLPLAAYILQLCDADCAGIRALKITPPLGSTSRCDVSREEIRTSNADWSHRMPERQKKKILELLNEGVSPRQVAQRCGVSDPTIYRIRGEARKKAAPAHQPHPSRNGRRLAESDIDKMCAAYANGEPVNKLALRFDRAPNVLYGELRKRGVAKRRIHWDRRKAAENES